MKTVTKSVAARELPAGWREEGQFAPDDRVTVMVQEEDPALTALRAGLDRAAASLDRGEGKVLSRDDIETIKAEVREKSPHRR